jgi:hypothetical protein
LKNRYQTANVTETGVSELHRRRPVAGCARCVEATRRLPGDLGRCCRALAGPHGSKFSAFGLTPSPTHAESTRPPPPSPLLTRSSRWSVTAAPPPHSSIHLDHNSALDPSTSSTSCLSRLRGGKGTLPTCFRSELTGSSPSSWSTVASSFPPLFSFSDLHPHFLNLCGCSGLDVIAGNCPGEPERHAGASRAGHARHGRRWQTSTASLVLTVSPLPIARMECAVSRSASS